MVNVCVSGCSRERVFTSDFVVNSTNTILVTTNYRLGALGTFANDISQGTPTFNHTARTAHRTRTYVSEPFSPTRCFSGQATLVCWTRSRPWSG